MTNKIPGIDLDHWLANANSQGLPKKDNSEGKLFYKSPKKGCAAWSGAGPGRVDLSCSLDPQFSGSGHGVRPVKLLK